MREFSAEYLRDTRVGMWDDSREALSPLELDSRERVLDVGCGTGVLSQVLAEMCADGPERVIGCDADLELLSLARAVVPVLGADARRLPFTADAFDLVVCQALLINLQSPSSVLEEFVRVSSDLVAAVEPDNGAVTLDSSVDSESALTRRAREAFITGVETDVTLGDDLVDAFERAGIEHEETRRYDHVRTIEPPYDEHALGVARRAATGAGLEEDRETLRETLSEDSYDALRSEWREMGREIVTQMRERRYRRRVVVPFYVTVGRVR